VKIKQSLTCGPKDMYSLCHGVCHHHEHKFLPSVPSYFPFPSSLTCLFLILPAVPNSRIKLMPLYGINKTKKNTLGIYEILSVTKIMVVKKQCKEIIHLKFSFISTTLHIQQLMFNSYNTNIKEHFSLTKLSI
jgi:hypothetical protein